MIKQFDGAKGVAKVVYRVTYRKRLLKLFKYKQRDEAYDEVSDYPVLARQIYRA